MSTFLAPSLVFLAPRMLLLGLLVVVPDAVFVVRTAVEEMARDGAGWAVLSEAESEVFKGDLGRDAVPLPFVLAFKKGEAVRLMPGVPVREGGLLGLLIAGLSHEEKKSSAGSPAGVFVPVPSLSSLISSTVTSSGYLYVPPVSNSSCFPTINRCICCSLTS